MTNPDHGAAEEQKRQKGGNIHVRGELNVETKFPPELVKQYTTSNKEEAAHRQKIFWVELTTMFAVIIYAALAAWQGCSTQQAATAATDAAKASKTSTQIASRAIYEEQRAWLTVKSRVPDKNRRLKVGEPIITDYSVENLGKTEARGLVGELSMEMVDKQSDPNFTYIGRRLDKIEAGAILPGVPFVSQAAMFPQNGSDMHVATPEIARRFNAGEVYFVIYGKLTYDDSFGCNHFITFCSWAGGGTIPTTACEKYNNSDARNPGCPATDTPPIQK